MAKTDDVVLRRQRANFCFRLGIEVYDDLLTSVDDLLKGGNLHQLPAADRAACSLQGDNQVSPLLFKLNERKPVVDKLVHLEITPSQSWYLKQKIFYSGCGNLEHFNRVRCGWGSEKMAGGHHTAGHRLRYLGLGRIWQRCTLVIAS